MKKIAFTLFLALFACCATVYAQEPEAQQHVLASDSIPPSYPDGQQAFYKLISKGIKKRHMPSKSGKAIVYFVVEKDGTLSNVKIIRGIEQKVDDRIVELVKKSKKWNPGTINGRLTRASYSLPITINIYK